MSSDPVASILQDPRFQGQPITWNVTTEQYDTIRHAWLTHVVAEEKLFGPYTQQQWDEQLAIMLGVFAEDCVMELVPSGERWQGKAQTEAFYRGFIASFEGMQWVPQALVIGPQGVLDVVNMTGILRRPLAGLTELGQQVHFQWMIYFPWLPAEARFRGETIYAIRPLTVAEGGTA